MVRCIHIVVVVIIVIIYRLYGQVLIWWDVVWPHVQGSMVPVSLQEHWLSVIMHLGKDQQV